jgi:hypothetical protein
MQLSNDLCYQAVTMMGCKLQAVDNPAATSDTREPEKK